MKQLQETFDTVVAHLRSQGRKSLFQGNQCAYRAPDGTKCAAGCLIPDDKYLNLMEGDVVGVHSLAGRAIMDEGYDVAFVKELQICHDMEDVPEWEACFARIANSFGLHYTSPGGV